MMAIRVHNIQFTKNDDGTYHASLDLHTSVEVKKIDTQCDTRTLSQTYYTGNEGQITDELKTAFHVAGLLLEKIIPNTNAFFVIPSAGDAPELWIDENAYYSNNKPNEQSFPECLQACIEAINEYTNGNGEKLKYRGSSSTLAL